MLSQNTVSEEITVLFYVHGRQIILILSYKSQYIRNSHFVPSLIAAHLLCYVRESVGDEESGVNKSVDTIGETSAVSGVERGRRNSYAGVPAQLIQLVQL